MAEISVNKGETPVWVLNDQGRYRANLYLSIGAVKTKDRAVGESVRVRPVKHPGYYPSTGGCWSNEVWGRTVHTDPGVLKAVALEKWQKTRAAREQELREANEAIEQWTNVDFSTQASLTRVHENG